MEFIWECMMIGFKGALGMVFWMFALAAVGVVISGISYVFNRDTSKKPKYEGQKIVLQGGKDNGGEK